MLDVPSLNWNLFEEINGSAGHGGLLDSIMIFAADKLIFLLPLLLLVFWFALARWSPLAPHNAQANAARMEGHIALLLSALAVIIALEPVMNLMSSPINPTRMGDRACNSPV